MVVVVVDRVLCVDEVPPPEDVVLKIVLENGVRVAVLEVARGVTGQ